MSDRMEKTREALASPGIVQQEDLDAALAEVEEWETRLASTEACLAHEETYADGMLPKLKARAVAAEAERDRLKDLLRGIVHDIVNGDDPGAGQIVLARAVLGEQT